MQRVVDLGVGFEQAIQEFLPAIAQGAVPVSYWVVAVGICEVKEPPGFSLWLLQYYHFFVICQAVFLDGIVSLIYDMDDPLR